MGFRRGFLAQNGLGIKCHSLLFFSNNVNWFLRGSLYLVPNKPDVGPFIRCCTFQFSRFFFRGGAGRVKRYMGLFTCEDTQKTNGASSIINSQPWVACISLSPPDIISVTMRAMHRLYMQVYVPHTLTHGSSVISVYYLPRASSSPVSARGGAGRRRG